MTFVSAIYNNNSSSIIGGRGRDLTFYISSLRNISNLGFPLIIYTSPEEVERTEKALEPFFKKIKVIPYSLENFLYFEKFINWKKNNINLKNINNDRNEILCFSKPFWLKNATEHNYFNSEIFLWIDSGLTHHGIFPEKKGGVELLTNPPTSFYYPENTNNIFTPILGNNLKNIIKQDKMFFCSTPWRGETNFYINYLKKYNNLNPSTIKFNTHLVGGIFGSYIPTIKNFYSIYDIFLQNFLEEGERIFEEQIFSSMIHVYPELFDTYTFNTWYFYSPGERCSYLERDGDSFYKIFERLNSN